MKIPGVRVKDPSASCYSTKIFDKRIFTTQMYDNKTVQFVNVLVSQSIRTMGVWMDICVYTYIETEVR